MSKHQQHFREVITALSGENQFAGFPLDTIPTDTQGFQSPENAPFFDAIFARFQPECLLELGSWKGTSAIMFAKRMLSYCPEPVIACVDTWIGSQEHWLNPKARGDLHLRWGYPTLYQRFVANVLRAGVAEFIKPMPMMTRTAIKMLARANVKVDAIYVDASHEYREVLDDLEGTWGLLAHSGFVIVDDFRDPEVKRAVCDFCRRPEALASYNADAPWPEVFMTKSKTVHDAAVAAYRGLAPVAEAAP